jgi:hypothetical protein
MQIADRLAELLREVEAREKALSEKELSLKTKTEKADAREQSIQQREISVRAESEKLQQYRDVAEIRRQAEDIRTQTKAEAERVHEQRLTLAREQEAFGKESHLLSVELGDFKKRLVDKERELQQAAEVLRDEKIRHHEKVLKELAIIEQKKMELVR